MTFTTLMPGPIPQILWGSRLQTTITFSYPAALVATRFWREPRPGSELSQVNDGQDAWIVGRDFRAAFKARWLRQDKWCEFQRFLDWAVGGNTFALVPDAVNAPLFVLPGCLLVEPFDKVDPTLEDDGTQAQDFSVRNPIYDLGLAWR